MLPQKGEGCARAPQKPATESFHGNDAHVFLPAEFRGRELGGDLFFGIILDGIRLSPDLTAVVAVGMTCDGRKIVLAYQVGSSENREVCDDLLRRIIRRRFKPVERLFCVLDGSDALKWSLIAHYHDAVTQRCLIHKERNIRGYLSKPCT
jgi:transposase-like protein